MPSSFSPVVRTCIPGRIRWATSHLAGRADLCSALAWALSQIPGVRSVKVSSLTGSILVEHDGLTAQNLTEAIERLLPRLATGEVVASPAPPAPKQRSSSSTPSFGSQLGADWSSFLSILRIHRQSARRAIGVSVVERFFEGLPPALIGLAVDSASMGPDATLAKVGDGSITTQFATLGGLGAVFWTADSLMGYLQTLTSAKLSTDIQLQLRNELYAHFQTLDLAQIEREVPGYWESVFQDDVLQVAKFFENGLNPIITILVNALLVFIQLSRVSLSLAVLQLLMLPGLYFISTALLPPIQERRKLAHKAQGRMSALLSSNIRGISTIASFAKEDEEAAHVAEVGGEAIHQAERANRLGAAYVPAIQMMVGVGFLGTLVTGGILAHQKKLGTGQFSALGYSSLRFLIALGHTGVTIEAFQKARLAMERIDDFRRRTPQVIGGTQALPAASVRGHFQLDRITFGYSPDEPLFKDFSLDFPAGKVIGLVGQTGAGKSTLIKLLLRFYEISGGTIYLDGTNLRDLKMDDLRRSMSYVPQQAFIFPGTVRQNIAYSHPEATLEEVMTAAKLAAAHSFIEQLPQGYETQIGGGARALSGGQNQRLAIARALLSKAQVLLFDEATSAVDNETEAAIQRSLYQYSTGRTTIIVAHRLSTIRQADLIYVLDEGTVRESGTHDQLLRNNGLYAGFWRVQTGEGLRSPNTTGKTTKASPAARRPAVLNRAITTASKPAPSKAPAKKTSAQTKKATSPAKPSPVKTKPSAPRAARKPRTA